MNASLARMFKIAVKTFVGTDVKPKDLLSTVLMIHSKRCVILT